MAQRNQPASVELEFSDIDLHFGRLMQRLANAERPALEMAAALASHATGNGDVCVRLAEFAGRALPALGPSVTRPDSQGGTRSDAENFIAPALDAWMALLRDCTVVGAPGDFRPLVLDDAGRLYLHRYWAYEKCLADDLLARAEDAADIDEALLRDGLKRYFPDARDIEQTLAAATAVLRRLCVISGGPGTGKTTTVVKILALLAEQAGGREIAIGVAAPTGKAAARVQDAIRGALDRLNVDLFTRASFPQEAHTLHRLLGARPDSVYYRRNRDNPLPLDVLVVDEASMADLALAAKLLEALPAHARLILIGDKDQLASVEAGAVLGEICGSRGYTPRFAKRLASVCGVAATKIATAHDETSVLSDSIALLEKSYRFGPESGIGTLARRVNEGNGAEALALLKSGTHADIAWRTWTPADLRARVAGSVVEGLRAYFEAVHRQDAPERIFECFNRFRVLCAHRSGLSGATALNRTIEDVLDEQRLISARDTWYAGRPVMITRNDYNLRLFNGDVGIALPDANGRLKVFFGGTGEAVRSVAPSRLPEHETVYAMTIHKSQGSEFGRVLMVLPGELSPIMSRELVYTGITRAMSGVEIWGSEALFKHSGSPVSRWYSTKA